MKTDYKVFYLVVPSLRYFTWFWHWSYFVLPSFNERKVLLGFLAFVLLFLGFSLLLLRFTLVLVVLLDFAWYVFFLFSTWWMVFTVLETFFSRFSSVLFFLVLFLFFFCFLFFVFFYGSIMGFLPSFYRVSPHLIGVAGGRRRDGWNRPGRAAPSSRRGPRTLTFWWLADGAAFRREKPSVFFFWLADAESLSLLFLLTWSFFLNINFDSNWSYLVVCVSIRLLPIFTFTSCDSPFLLPNYERNRVLFLTFICAYVILFF